MPGNFCPRPRRNSALRVAAVSGRWGSPPGAATFVPGLVGGPRCGVAAVSGRWGSPPGAETSVPDLVGGPYCGVRLLRQLIGEGASGSTAQPRVPTPPPWRCWRRSCSAPGRSTSPGSAPGSPETSRGRPAASPSPPARIRTPTESTRSDPHLRVHRVLAPSLASRSVRWATAESTTSIRAENSHDARSQIVNSIQPAFQCPEEYTTMPP